MSLVTVTAAFPAYGGRSIGAINGKVVMIKGAIPGERVEAKIEEEKRDYLKAETVAVLDSSADRITPPCPYFGVCGGCQLQFIAYERQVSIKEEVLRGALKRLAKVDPFFESPLIHTPPWHYRLRGQFKAGKNSLGFYRERTRDVVDIQSCPLMHETINGKLGAVRGLLGSVDFKEIHISTDGDRGIAALLKGVKGGRKEAERAGAGLMSFGFSGAVIEFDAKSALPLSFGEPGISLDLQGLNYGVSPLSFFQSHWALNRKVAAAIKERLAPLGGKRLLDLYSGAGNFSLLLAAEAAEIIAVEENPAAIQEGLRNLERNGIGNYRFIAAPAERLSLSEAVDIVITDPPRLGLSNAALGKIVALRPERIVYISCNPSTLGRDLGKLAAAYEIESVRAVDFFPQTYHIESLAFLRRRAIS